ncbi:MAG: hypothetical protein M1830_002848 [Pleopsidium flavum]|nr:MAG: hypothetical protein M1830_002848 [Pleopsidium flavum]
MSRRYPFGSQRRRRNAIENRSGHLPLDTAGQAVRQFLRGQVRTDLPFKLSNYRPGGQGTESLLTRILTEYDVPVQSLKSLARDFCAYSQWVRRTISPVFWTRLVISLNSIWVNPEPQAPTALGEEDQRGSFERFLCKVEDKMRDGTWNEIAGSIKYIEIVDCSNLVGLKVGDDRFREQMLRFLRVLESLSGLRVFKWKSELPISLSLLRVLAHRPRMIKCQLHINASAFEKNNLQNKATVRLVSGEEIPIPFYRGFEGFPTAHERAGTRKIGARVEVFLEEANDNTCSAIPEWVPLLFVQVSILTVRGPSLSTPNARPARLSDEERKNTTVDASIVRNLVVEELVMSKISGTAARSLTSRANPRTLRDLVLEWCIDYVQILTPLAKATRLRRLEVYSPSASQYTDNDRALQTQHDIFLCDFLRSETFELRRLHVFGGMFSHNLTLHNHLFFAIQTHLKSLRQLRIITSDEFNLSELREMGICAPHLFDLRIRATAESLLASPNPAPSPLRSLH